MKGMVFYSWKKAIPLFRKYNLKEWYSIVGRKQSLYLENII